MIIDQTRPADKPLEGVWRSFKSSFRFLKIFILFYIFILLTLYWYWSENHVGYFYSPIEYNIEYCTANMSHFYVVLGCWVMHSLLTSGITLNSWIVRAPELNWTCGLSVTLHTTRRVQFLYRCVCTGVRARPYRPLESTLSRATPGAPFSTFDAGAGAGAGVARRSVHSIRTMHV